MFHPTPPPRWRTLWRLVVLCLLITSLATPALAQRSRGGPRSSEQANADSDYKPPQRQRPPSGNSTSSSR